MQRFLFGYLLAACSAILLGLLLGWSQSVWAFINPVVQLLRPIAPVAWLPFLVLLVGIGDTPAITIIFIAGFFPILLATVSAVRNMDPIYRKVAQNFGLNQIELLARIVFPAIFPQIIASLHQALSTCWIFLVSGEMVGSQSGLGFLVMDAKNCIRADALLATMLVIGLIGLLLDLLIGKLEKLIALKWGLGITKYIGEEGD
jgi:NitT/TauT family transport system permease protein